MAEADRAGQRRDERRPTNQSSGSFTQKLTPSAAELRGAAAGVAHAAHHATDRAAEDLGAVSHAAQTRLQMERKAAKGAIQNSESGTDLNNGCGGTICGSLWSVLAPLIQDVVLSIQLPQELVVTNPRIRLLYKFIQAWCLVALGLYVYIYRIWTVGVQPQPYLFSLWPEAMTGAVIAQADNKRHCNDVASYQHTYYGTATYEYRPQDCRTLFWGDGWVKKPDSLVIFTYISEGDEYRTNNNTGECLHAPQACAASGASYVLDARGCRCIRAADFFVKNAEMTIISFYHGFQVRKPDGTVEKGSSTENVVTFFQKEDGTPCQINGKEQLNPGEIGPSGIQATIEDWLKCAGATLDSLPADLGNSDPSLVVIRMMGSRLVLNMNYVNRHDMVHCYITPRVVPAWTPVHQTVLAADDMSLGEETFHYRSRSAYGLQIRFEVKGDMRYFEFNALVTGLVNVLFLASVPRFFIQFLCCYCLGAMSGIYRNAKRTRFSVNEQMRTAVARALMPLVAFRGLQGGKYQHSVQELELLHAKDIQQYVKDGHADEVLDGRLEARHTNRMVMMLCGALTGQTSEYLDPLDLRKLQNANDVITADMLANMLHFRREKCWLEKLMDDTDQSLDAQVFASLVQGGRSNARKKKHAVEEDEIPVKKMDSDHTRLKKLLIEVEELSMRTKRAESAILKANETTGLADAKATAASERAELSELLAEQQRNQDNEDRRHHHRFDKMSKEEDKMRKDALSQREAASTVEGRLQKIEARTRQVEKNLASATMRQEEVETALQLLHGRDELERNSVKAGPQRLR